MVAPAVAEDLIGLLYPVTDLDLLPGNPRKGNVDAVARSYARFGQTKPIVARHWENGHAYVVAGNHQLMAARKLGWDKIAVVWCDHLSAAEAKGFALADNKIAELATYEEDLLAEMLQAVVDTGDQALLRATAFSAAELDKLLGVPPHEEPPISALELPPGGVCYQDELVVLYVGDSLQVTHWLGADVMITDPPYGLGGDLSKTGFTGEERFGTQEWDKTLETRDAVLKLWGNKPYAMFGSPRRLDQAPPHEQHPLIWNKAGAGAIGIGDCTFPWRLTYEMIYVNGEGWTGYRDEAILHFPHGTSEATKIGHPTPKPIELMEALIAKAPPGLIADPFAGSGSTLIAARRLGRRAIGIEIDPTYAQVATKRLQEED